MFLKNLVLAGLFLTPALAFAQIATTTDTTATTSPSQATTATPTLPNYQDRAVVEAEVRKTFADAPVMIEIARCESKFRQFTDAGNPLNGGAGGMIGIFQINQSVHKAFALGQGYDITTVEGNMGYARYLYTKEGTNPWISSFPCWSGATNNPEGASTTSPPSSPLTNNLSFGMIHPQVLTLQQTLNRLQFTIAPDGPGSPGNETTKFGSLTRETVRKFQCAQNIVCSGDEASTGYGYVGARTRAALLAAAPGNAPTTTPTTSTVATAELQTKIAELQKMIADLQAQIALLSSQ